MFFRGKNPTCARLLLPRSSHIFLVCVLLLNPPVTHSHNLLQRDISTGFWGKCRGGGAPKDMAFMISRGLDSSAEPPLFSALLRLFWGRTLKACWLLMNSFWDDQRASIRMEDNGADRTRIARKDDNRFPLSVPPHMFLPLHFSHFCCSLLSIYIHIKSCVPHSRC